jgi:autotransporter-associated beta strand protein
VTFSSDAAQTVTTSLSGSGGLIKQGAGTLTISSVNTYSGSTVVDGGTLKLADTGPVAGACYWLDASSTAIVKDAAGKVSAWNDVSGNGRNFTQTTASNQPTYSADGLAAGKPSIHFDGGTINLKYAAGTSPQTVFIVNKPDATAFGGLSGIWGNDNPGDKGIRGASATSWQTAGDGNDFINGTGGAIYINGSTVAGGSFGTAGAAHLMEATRGANHTAAYNDTDLGGYYGGRYYKGDISEVLVYDTVLSAADRAAVENYLMYKWFGTGSNSAISDVIPDTSPVALAATAKFDLNSHVETVGPLSGSGKVALGSGTMTVNNSDGFNGVDSIFSGSIDGAGSLKKVGPGKLTLSGSSTYTGGTTVSEGLLQIDSVSALPAGGSLTIDGTGSVVLSSGLGTSGSSVASSQGVNSAVVHAAASGSTSPVPEPGTLVLLAVGALAGLVVALRRRG